MKKSHLFIFMPHFFHSSAYKWFYFFYVYLFENQRMKWIGNGWDIQIKTFFICVNQCQIKHLFITIRLYLSFIWNIILFISHFHHHLNTISNSFISLFLSEKIMSESFNTCNGNDGIASEKIRVLFPAVWSKEAHTCQAKISSIIFECIQNTKYPIIFSSSLCCQSKRSVPLIMSSNS